MLIYDDKTFQFVCEVTVVCLLAVENIIRLLNQGIKNLVKELVHGLHVMLSVYFVQLGLGTVPMHSGTQPAHRYSTPSDLTLKYL